MAIGDYTPRDWLVVFGLATLVLTWWVSFGMMRDRPQAADAGSTGLN
jgi:hypothetical protein